MKQIKALFKNKKIIISVVAVLLVATVGTVFVLSQPKQNQIQQEAMSDEDHAKLVANLKASREEAEQAKIQAEKKAEEEKKVAEEKAKEEQAKKEKEEAEKKAEEEKQKEQQINRSQSGNTTPVQPKPSATVSNTAPKQNQTQPAPTPAPAPKPAPAQPTPEKPKERKRLGQLGNSGLEFSTYEEARDYGNKILASTGSDWDEWNKKMGFEIFGWSGWTVDYSDGTQTWTIHWKP